jgi:hypothetical protein
MKRHLLGAAAAAVLCALVLVPAASAATQAEIQESVAKAVGYIKAQQQPTGEIVGFGGDWSATALATAGVDASEVRVAAGDPSFQDALQAEYGKSEWAGEPIFSATDYERATLVSYAAGIDPARVSAESNLPAQLAGTWNSTTGSFGSGTNGAAFGILALRRTPVPTWALAPSVEFLRQTQHTDGGWNYSGATSEAAKKTASEQDMTGSVVAALCEAGVPAYDPTVANALTYLHGQQIAATGGFKYVYGEPSADVAAWVVSGIDACGMNPQSAEWTTTEGKTPIDFLLSQQEPNGSFIYAGSGNLYTTQSALRAVAGGVFTAAPLTQRATPAVADGTPVPHVLAIQLGPNNVQMCKVTAPAGAPLTTVLEAAEGTDAYPNGCVRSLTVADGHVAAVDGIEPAGSDESWLARLDRGGAAVAAGQPVGFGETIALWVGATPANGGGTVTGPTGATGPAGATGATGAAGPQGKEGKPGKQGKRGKRGPAAKRKAHRTCKRVKVNGHKRVRCTKARPGHRKNASGRAKARRISAARALS